MLAQERPDLVKFFRIAERVRLNVWMMRAA
jgi:hypothetical protein